MRPISKIIIHCAATKPTLNIGAAEIKNWHTDPHPDGNGWSDIGYHAVIRRNGDIEYGRPIERTGAHVRGHNTGSIGICLVGGHGSSADDQFGDHFSEAQFKALIGLLQGLRLMLPGATIHGHNEFAAKACPGFRVQDWLQEVGL